MKKAILSTYLYRLKTLSALAIFFFCMQVSAQMPQVLKDISGLTTLHSQSTTGYTYKSFNGEVYFVADDGVSGYELWKTNGTEAGTKMVKDINPGPTGITTSAAPALVEMNGFLYFAANHVSYGQELWRTDGTEAGTVLVKDAVAGTTGIGPNNLFVMNGVLYFNATTSANGMELWKTDGTASGTVLIKDMNPGGQSSSPANFTNVNGILFFTATTAANGLELWKSDGTTAGTVLVKDINPGATSSTFLSITSFGGFLYFGALDAVNGWELWKSDGTDAGTAIVKDINPGTGTGSTGPYIPIGSQLCFLGNDGTTGNELWITDGTNTGTTLLKDINPGTAASTPQNFFAIGNTIYFTATDGTNGVELWKTDGTSAGTVLVKDINPGITSSTIAGFINMNGTLYFRTSTSASGSELWKTDGTDAGTVIVKDLAAGSTSSSPQNFAVINNLIYFTATVGGQTYLFKTDGTDAGTVVLNNTVVAGGTFATLFGVDNKLYFMYNGYKPGIPSTATGREPWISDGTDAGTKLLKDINGTTSPSTPANLCKIGNTVFFTADDGVNGSELWKTDGTAGGTVLVKDIRTGTTGSSPANLVNVNGTLFFSANGSTANSIELWKSNGTDAGTVMVKDIRPGNSPSSPALLTPAGNLLFFTATDGVAGVELWKSDGTESGTVMVRDIVAGAGNSNITKLTNVNGTVFFTATVAASGNELWKSDGTLAGTVLVKDIVVGTGSPGIDDLVAYNGKLYFSASDGVNGNEPWVSDGTDAGTMLFVNIATSSSYPNSNPTNFKVAGGKLYFTAFTATTSFEPWVSDGTPAGTYMITEVVPSGGGSNPFGFTAMNGFVYFNAIGTGMGREIWRTDGTALGTTLVKDINAGSGDSNPDQFTVVNNTIFFTATTPAGGIELYKSDGTEAGTIGYDLYPGSTTSNPTSLMALNDMLLFTATHELYDAELWKAVIPPVPSSSFSIAGDTTVCVGNTATYAAINVIDPAVTYHWSLPDGGGTLSVSDSIATVTWTTQGDKRIELYLSNNGGSTAAKQKIVHVITGGIAPTQAPIITEFARTLSASNFPNGTHVQWYRNSIAITGAIQPTYYAALDGVYTAKFISVCATGPESNAITFVTTATSQTTTFNNIPDITLTPTTKIALIAAASSGLPVFFQKILGPGYIQNDTLFITGNGTLVGDIVIKAMQPGNDTYSPAPDVQQTIRVIRGNQAITFDPIPDMIYGPQLFQLTASSSVGLPVSYSIIAGGNYASIQSGNKLKLTGAGTVTIRASQIGNVNYFGATSVDRTFCIGVRTLAAITGDVSPCINTYRYNAQKIPGASYQWTLSGGGIMTTNLDTAWITWQTPGEHTLKVSANSGCDFTFTDESILTIATSNNFPAQVTGMLPAHGVADQFLPLRLSWIPGTNTTKYDVYVWKASDPQPATPYVTNIEDITFTLPANSFAYNTTYKWRVVSKNPCSQTAGPIQEFSIIPLPDLLVSDVQMPATATSGQTVTISWKVTNIGPGRTLPNSTWYDGVYFALDTVPNVSFRGSPNWDPTSWNSLTAAGRPLLLGKKIRPSSLESGQSYTNTIDFTLPLSYSFPVYAYVITDNEHPNWKIMQVNIANDTAKKQTPMNITLVPTPDLRVDSVFTPGSTFSGSLVNVTYKVKNYGVLTPDGSSWVDSVFISQNPLFDRDNAIPLKMPKANGSYYPDAYNAGYIHQAQLQFDSSYTKSIPVVIPNFIFGTWFIYVKTNAKSEGAHFMYEGSLGDNNLGQTPIQVYLAPTPKLTVSSLNLAVSNASTTQPIGVNWNIKNEGFADNYEKNKGHYFKANGTCPLPSQCYTPNTICDPILRFNDSLSQGSSYWIDRIYLSTDAGGLNLSNAILIAEQKHGIQYGAGALHEDNITLCAPRNTIPPPVNVAHAIYPGSNFPTTLNFNVPSNLAPGSYYVYVYTNPTKTVFEYPGTAQIKRSDLPIVIQRPDIIVPVISVPTTANGGQPITVSYQVQNNGLGAVFNHIRRDRVYISNSPSFDGTATLIGTNTFTESLPVNAAIPHTFNYNLPHATTGVKYFYVISNYDSAFKETNYINNLSVAASSSITAATPADLIVSSTQTADSVFTVFTDRVIFTITNGGSGTATGTWTDSVFISCSPTFNAANSYYIGKRIQSRTLAPSENYKDTLTLNMKYGFDIKNCFPAAMYSNAYFFVKTNADNNAYEGTATNNNIGGSGNKTLVNPLVDHVVSNVTGPDVTTVGAVYPVSWRVKNIGYNPVVFQYYNSWYDGIYFSADSLADEGDIKASEYLKYLRIDRNQDTGFSRSMVVPYMPSGDYYVYVHNNYNNHIPGEKILHNNVNFIRNELGQAKKIQVILPLIADLTDSIISAPATVDAGQPITVIYRIKNNGNGITFPGNNFQNRVLLSSDFTVAPYDGDRELATRNRTSILPAGEFYNDTVTAYIPSNTLPGTYVLITQANSNNAVIETNTQNNFGYSLITVVAPPQTDLIVSKVLHPDTVTLGYTIDTAKWVIKNVSGEQARGVSKDGIYLSAGNLFDSTAVLLGIRNKNILMQPLQEDTVRMAPMVTGVVEGNYNMFIKADLLSNIFESDEDNNIGVSAIPVYVKAKELLLNVNEPNTLEKIDRYYKLRIPDSLIGSTILVTLKTPDSLVVNNEMFIGGGFVPTAANNDYRFEIPNYGNQQIVMTDVTDSVYYIMYRCVTPNPPVQNVLLKAVKLPFAILNVHTNAGANIGNVTVRIRGSLFRDSMTAKLSNGSTTIYASAVYYTNSGQVFATFPLQGKPFGIYDVTLTKPDLSTAVLASGFSIVPANNGGLITGGGINTGAGNGNEPGCDPGAASGLNSQLSVELVSPSRVLVSRPLLIFINYSNPTNFDIPAQSRVLYSEAGMKLAFTKEGVPSGTTSIYLELVEPGGPPGIIRAGASGTIIVHSKAPPIPPTPNKVLFKLK